LLAPSSVPAISMTQSKRMLLAVAAWGALASTAAAAEATAAANESHAAEHRAAAALAKLQDFAEHRSGRNATSFAHMLVHDAVHATAEEETTAKFEYSVKLGVLRTAVHGTSGPGAVTEKAFADVERAAARVRGAARARREDIWRRYDELRKGEKAEGRRLQSNVHSAAKAALHAARRAGASQQQSEQKSEALVESAERLRVRAELSSEGFYDQVKRQIKPLVDALDAAASRREAEHERAISELRYTEEKKEVKVQAAAALTDLDASNRRALAAVGALQHLTASYAGRNATAEAIGIARAAAREAAAQEAETSKDFNTKLAVLQQVAKEGMSSGTVAAGRGDLSDLEEQLKSDQRLQDKAQGAAADAIRAADRAFQASRRQIREMRQRYLGRRSADSAGARHMEREAKAAAKAALRAARQVERVRRGVGMREHDFEGQYDRSEHSEEDTEQRAERAHDDAEDAQEKFYQKLEDEIEPRMDALEDAAQSRREARSSSAREILRGMQLDATVRRIEAKVSAAEAALARRQKAAANATAAPMLAPAELSGDLVNVFAGRAPLLLVLALVGVAGGAALALRLLSAPRRIAAPALLG